MYIFIDTEQSFDCIQYPFVIKKKNIQQTKNRKELSYLIKKEVYKRAKAKIILKNEILKSCPPK